MPTLADLGVTRKESHRYQQQAAVPEKEFKAYVAKVNKNSEELTSVGVRRLAANLKNAEKAKILIFSQIYGSLVFVTTVDLLRNGGLVTDLPLRSLWLSPFGAGREFRSDRPF